MYVCVWVYCVHNSTLCVFVSVSTSVPSRERERERVCVCVVCTVFHQGVRKALAGGLQFYMTGTHFRKIWNNLCTSSCIIQ